MTKTLEELAEDIINEIEKEDIKYAIKHYGFFKVQKTAQKIIDILETNEVNKWKYY